MTSGDRVAEPATDENAQRPTEALIATNVPFWRLERGSHRRIEAMLRSLAALGVRWSLAYLADEPFPPDFAPFGVVKARRLPHTPGPVPRGVGGFLSKRWKGTLNAIRVAAAGRRDVESADPNPSSKRLSDFESGEAIEALTEWLLEKRFDAALVEYVHLAYLHRSDEKVPADRRPLWLVDTHDVMWQRAERHAQAGAAHWLSIGREEESRALSPFDATLAIQATEQRTLREMLPGRRVLLAPHAVEVPQGVPEISLPSQFDGRRPMSIGFIGSGGAMNADSAKFLLEEIWPRVEEACGESAVLWLAGDATERFRDRFRSPQMRFLGRVADLQEFYARIDVAANPVRFGAGLKIKNVEALAFGRALATTTVGAAGMEDGAGTAFAVGDDATSFAGNLVRWSRNPASLGELARRGRDFALSRFSPQAAYGEVLAVLREATAKRRSSRG